MAEMDITHKVRSNEDGSLESSIEKKLTELYQMQLIDSNITKIRIIRGELPLEVEDLRDETQGLKVKLETLTNEIANAEERVRKRNEGIAQSNELLVRYKEQQNNVRNNREYEALEKEVEFQNLEIQLSEKQLREAKRDIEAKSTEVERIVVELAEKEADLATKGAELDDIIAETEKDEQILKERLTACESNVEERLLSAYKRIRKNVHNGLAVVKIEREACGGCFNKIPPQVQLDIALHKKIVICEFCGRVLIDRALGEKIEAETSIL